MNLFATLLLLLSFAFNQYLQEGIYPDCSYVIVTEDGWRIHKNQEGRVLSMLPQKKHNDKIGKYSFDKFGNLIPFTECEAIQKQKKMNSTENVDVEISVKLFGDKNSSKQSKFFIGASYLNPLGDITDSYGSGININLGYKLSE